MKSRRRWPTWSKEDVCRIESRSKITVSNTPSNPLNLPTMAPEPDIKPGNKIRVRLEKLEALVDANASANGEAPPASEKAKVQPSKSLKSQTPKIQNQPRPADNATKSGVPAQTEQCDMPTDSSDLWKSLPDFLNLVECDDENSGHSPEMNDLTSLGSSQLETLSSASTLVDPVRSSSTKCYSSSPPSFDMYQPDEFNAGPISSDPDRKPISATEGDPRFFSAENNPGCTYPFRPSFNPYGYYGCAGTQPMSPHGAPVMPYSPIIYPSQSTSPATGALLTRSQTSAPKKAWAILQATTTGKECQASDPHASPISPMSGFLSPSPFSAHSLPTCPSHISINKRGRRHDELRAKRLYIVPRNVAKCTIHQTTEALIGTFQRRISSHGHFQFFHIF